MAADLDSLITTEIPEGRQNLLDSHTNLERVAEYCENNYFQSDNKRAALEETKSYTTQSLASVAYQINTLAYNFLQMLDLQSSQIQEMESQINHISQTVSIHKEKVARREIGVLTTNKCSNRQYKIVAPANPERPIKYVRKPIDYASLDDVGHGVKTNQARHQVLGKRSSNSPYAPPASQYGTTGSGGGSQYGTTGGARYGGSSGNVSNASAGPAPTTKPPTPPQNRIYSHGGTLTRSSKSEYRAPPVVAPPQVPSNYAPNYPKTGGQQYGTLPHQQPQVGMVYPQPHDGQGGGATTMPRLSSHSMRSTHSTHSGNSSTPPPPSSNEGSHGGNGGRNRKISASSNDTENAYGGITRQSSSVSRQLTGVYGQYGAVGGMSRGSTPPSGTYGTLGAGGGMQRGSTPPSGTYGTLGAGGGLQRGSTPPSQSQYGTAPGRQGSKSPSQYMARNDRGATPPSALNTSSSSQQYGVLGGRPSNRPPSPPPMNAPNSAPVQLGGGMPPMFAGGPPGLASGQMLHQMPQAGGNPIYSRQQSAEMLYARQMSEGDTYSTRAQLGQQQTLTSQGELESAVYSRQSSLGGNPPQMSSVSSSVVLQENLGPTWVPKNYIEKVLAIYDYNADKEDELTFTEGQTIYVVKKNDDGWWEGVMEGITGLFPGNYVEAPI